METSVLRLGNLVLQSDVNDRLTERWAIEREGQIDQVTLSSGRLFLQETEVDRRD